HLRRPHVALVEVEQDVAERRPLLRCTGWARRARHAGRAAGSRGGRAAGRARAGGVGGGGGGGGVGGPGRAGGGQPVRRHEDLSAGPRSRLRAARSARALRKPRVLALRLPVSSSCVSRFAGELRRNSSLSST